ncbi:MAG: GNAT family N-acetyltransferase [Candidatus Latescibacteria bacterium]|nr:GNAT family N-acetyltransferase [Candidatus Latescibacterota bacterium]
MQRALKDGLVLRSVDEDNDRARQQFLDFFGLEGSEEQWSRDWADDLTEPERPTISGEDAWVVVDTNDGDRGVAGLTLIPQRWRYDGLELHVGRIEHVATAPAYRRRGLMSALMQAAHERSATLGHPLQVITGRADIYRRYGYTQAVTKWPRMNIPVAAIPALPDGEAPRFTLRTATVDDIPTILSLEQQAAPGIALTCARTADEWRYEMQRKKTRHSRTELVVDRMGTAVGFLALTPNAGHCYKYVVGTASSYLQTFEDVLRGMQGACATAAKEKGEDAPTQISFDDGPPVLKSLLGAFYPPLVYAIPGCWYLRAASPAALINHLAPVLEQRLEGSAANRYNGRIRIDFYSTKGLEIAFENGRISARDIDIAEDQRFAVDAGFSHHALLNLIFGHNTLAQLKGVLPDCSANPAATVLLEELFPVMDSQLWAIW